MKKIKFILSLTLILALAIPLFLMPISAADEEPTIDELVELAKEAQYFVAIFGLVYEELVYYMPNGALQSDLDESLIQNAMKMGYYDPEFDMSKSHLYNISAVDIRTGELYPTYRGDDWASRFPDTVTVEKVREDVRKYFVSDFLHIIDNAEFRDYLIDSYCLLGTDGYVYNHYFYAATKYIVNTEHYSETQRIPDWETAKVKERSENKITLEFDGNANKATLAYYKESGKNVNLEGKITIQYTKTNRGWRISGSTGNYYKGLDSVYASEIPETADNSVVYIALASVSVAALASVTFVSAKRKKAYIA